ncbi:unnamed protein product, partial [Oppiella nova]
YRVFEKKYFVDVPKGYDCIKCCGRYQPDVNKCKLVGSGVVVPTGKTVYDETLEDKTNFDI